MIDEPLHCLYLRKESFTNNCKTLQIIGPNQLSKYGMVVPRFVEAALNDEDIIIHSDGSQSRSFTWVDDVVEYLIKLAEIKKVKYTIGQTEEITIKALVELC